MDELEFINLEPTTMEEGVKKALEEAGFLTGLSEREAGELQGFILHGLKRASGADISTYVHKCTELPVNMAIETLGKIADKTWQKRLLRKVLFPEWLEDGTEPGRPTVTYGIYNWVIKYMGENPDKVPFKEIPTVIPLYVGYKNFSLPNKIPPA